MKCITFTLVLCLSLSGILAESLMDDLRELVQDYEKAEREREQREYMQERLEGLLQKLTRRAKPTSKDDRGFFSKFGDQIKQAQALIPEADRQGKNGGSAQADSNKQARKKSDISKKDRKRGMEEDDLLRELARSETREPKEPKPSRRAFFKAFGVQIKQAQEGMKEADRQSKGGKGTPHANMKYSRSAMATNDEKRFDKTRFGQEIEQPPEGLEKRARNDEKRFDKTRFGQEIEWPGQGMEKKAGNDEKRFDKTRFGQEDEKENRIGKELEESIENLDDEEVSLLLKVLRSATPEEKEPLSMS